MGRKHTPAENTRIAEAKADKDRNAGNRKIVKIVAKKDKITDEALISLDLADEDGRMVLKTDEGLYNLYRHDATTKDHLERYRCVDNRSVKCNHAFKCLQVNGKAYGFFVEQHNHLPHVNFELVETFRLLATVDEEGDHAELNDFQECHRQVKGKMSVPGPVDDKFLLYIVITAGIDKETFLRMPVAERFRHADYVGQTKQQIVDRLKDHSPTSSSSTSLPAAKFQRSWWSTASTSYRQARRSTASTSWLHWQDKEERAKLRKKEGDEDEAD